MSKYLVQNGNNAPIHAPLIPDPFVPYHCPRQRSLNAVCRVDRATLQRYLAPTPFTPVDDRVLVYVADFMNCNKVPFMDAGIVVPVHYGDGQGGYFLFEYEDDDAAIAAGRDLWGYPKKFGVIELLEDGERVRGTVVRKGVTLISIDCDLAQASAPPALVTTPHLNLHVQPAPDGGILNKRVIARDTSADFQLTSARHGAAQVQLAGIATDPLHEFAPLEVLGASYVIGDFFATEQNGWGRTVEVLR
ncbi:acetoacetate decarboxylase family protein [Paraburkholderia hayleyella]|uniref:acetoacetate decarboxylase family protein n=1 Tax=Paraburkholderia hayleyella TaxID=2152889 RepID=UPI0015802A20|nr:acetoacetate decarboxylase family protein [Paraburkholderia hayleyella]